LSFVITDINADAEGDHRENLNGEYVTFENTGDQSLDIGGWTLEDAAGRSYTFPDGTTVGSQETITVRTGSGTNTDTELYWGSGSPIWNNDGDTVIVRTADGNTILEESY
jgi:competence protein ComEC